MATKLIVASDLVAGQKLVLAEGSLLIENDAEASATMPGFVRVEVEVGVLYLEPGLFMETVDE